ncbi:MAG TPA: hypothetical protein VHH36_01490 [Candidatus Thermoplasmatota archaeon]|nr:hypothetical protein [Candidatus Thermoplasmatota archaeon]
MAFFDFVTDYRPEAVDLPIFLTLLLLEGVLSFDNAAILAAMVRKLPVEQRRKALLYGLGGAYVFRLAAILAVAFIVQNEWLKIVGGVYLVYLMLKHVLDRTPHDHEIPGLAKKSFLGLTPFWSVVIAVELADIAFALDQVLVAVGLFGQPTPEGGSKILLIVLASFAAILLLRVSAYYVGRLMDWFPKLETLAYVAVGWVGVKLIVVTTAHYTAYAHHPIVQFLEMKEVSIAVTLLVIVMPVAVKATGEWIERRKQRAA